MFEINDNLQVKRVYIQDSPAYLIDNVFKTPDLIVSHLNTEAPIFKSYTNPSYNGVYFFDTRHTFKRRQSFEGIFNFLIKLTGHTPSPREIYSNCFFMIDHDFNSVEDCIWVPHKDIGYTAVIYLNDDNVTGTNIYSDNKVDYYSGTEHYLSWRPKEWYKILYSAQAKFNRMFVFDGKRFFHGMAFSDRTYFTKKRIVLSIFLEHNYVNTDV